MTNPESAYLKGSLGTRMEVLLDDIEDPLMHLAIVIGIANERLLHGSGKDLPGMLSLTVEDFSRASIVALLLMEHREWMHLVCARLMANDAKGMGATALDEARSVLAGLVARFPQQGATTPEEAEEAAQRQHRAEDGPEMGNHDA